MNVERADIVGRACAVRSVFYFVLASLSGRRSMKKWVGEATSNVCFPGICLDLSNHRQ